MPARMDPSWKLACQVGFAARFHRPSLEVEMLRHGLLVPEDLSVIGFDDLFCLQERLRRDRFARHWHDVVRLDEAGFATAAFVHRKLTNAVARHKIMFFAEKAADRSQIDYVAAVSGGLQLVPAGDGAKALAEDYARMVDDGLLLEEAEPLETLMERCADIAARANSTAG